MFSVPVPTIPIDVKTVFFAFEVIATFAFALSGLFVARDNKLDAVGTFIATFLAAFGGGTLRDIMLMQRPFYWVTQSELLWGILFMSVLSSVTLKVTKLLSNRIIMVADAIGLGIFSATGTHLALLMGWPPMPCVMIGVITATFGGLLRDVVCNQKPMLMSDPSPYASVAFVGNWLLLGLIHLNWMNTFWNIVVAASVIAGGRLLLAFFGVKLPQLDGH
ncbi:trimeric intracellular cation channel family protein [Brachymonas sp. G13]|uniref:trimeric intracellular cation channel family protein n=1 Tax=Brachymonas TaxID=28219 RepID=UPI002E771529|nr:trimeric intracellular cation channel family protein [Brachymonas sp. J145]MEE1654365.1 trimeric intracellular cation channel family protein [Brachymonas sp. J145]